MIYKLSLGIPITPAVCPLSVYVHFSLSHTASLARSQCLLSAGPFLCVHCQWCVSTVCICPLFTFTHTLFFTHSQCFHSVGPFMCVRCQFVSVHCLLCVSTVSVLCPLSVVCVHCQCCVSTLCSVCPLSVCVCVHCL